MLQKGTTLRVQFTNLNQKDFKDSSQRRQCWDGTFSTKTAIVNTNQAKIHKKHKKR